jgi:hypothetical protein
VRKSFYSGLAAGLAVAGFATLWIGLALDEPYLEADSSRSLGLAFEKPPQVALRFLPDARIARALQYGSTERALEEAKIFAQRVAGGFLPSGWDEKCQADYHPSLCLGLKEYFASEDAEKKKKRKGVPKAIGRRTRVSFGLKDIPGLQQTDIGLLLNKAPQLKLPVIRQHAAKALQTQACPHNYSFSLARMLEFHMQDPSAAELMNTLDDHGLACLESRDPQAEYVALRIALLRVAQGKLAEAVKPLEQSFAAEHRRETHRVLYWKARVYRGLGDEKLADETRAQLVKQHPLAWQSIKNYNETGLDPLDVFRAVPPYPDSYVAQDPELDRALHWHRLLLRTEGAEYPAQRFVESIIRRFDEKTSPGAIQHLARTLDHAGHHRLQIMALTKLVNIQPQRVSVETLRLLFPRPYFEKIDQWTPKTDTAILLGLARQESGFDQKARSAANAVGLLQVLPSTAREVKRSRKGGDMLNDAGMNIEIGAAYFESLVRMFKGSIEKALASYNAGMGRVRGWDRRFGHVVDEQLYSDLIPFRETREYVTSILRNAYWYHRLFPQMTDKLRAETHTQTSRMLREQLDHATPPPEPAPLIENQSLPDDAEDEVETPLGEDDAEKEEGEKEGDQSLKDDQ